MSEFVVFCNFTYLQCLARSFCHSHSPCRLQAVFQHDSVQTYSKSGADKADIDRKINLLGLQGQALPPLCHEIGTIMSTSATEMQEAFMWVRDAARHGRKKL